MKAIGQIEAFLCDGDEHVSAHGNPDLCLDGVLAGTQKRLDPQVLLDPFEKQFHLPALAVKICNKLGLKRKVVGQKRDAFAAVVFGDDPPKGCRVIFAGVENCQHARLIADNAGVGFVHRIGVSAFEFGVGFGASDKKGVGLMDGKQALKVQIPTVEQVVGPWLDAEQVQGVDLVCLAVGNVNERGDGATQIEQGMQLDRCFVRSERRPRINRQTQIDRGCIEGVNGGIQIDRQRILRVQRSCQANQVLRKVGINLPRPCGICMGQRIARNRLAAKAHVIQPRCLRTKVDFYVAQRLSVGQLREGHREKLIQAGELLNLVIAPVPCNTSTKRAQRQQCHELRENKLALIHGGPLRVNAADHRSWPRRSNRDQTYLPKNQSESLTYKLLT